MSSVRVRSGLPFSFLTSGSLIAALTMSYPDTKIGGAEFQKARIPSIALWDSSPEIDEMGEFIFSLGPCAPSTGETASAFGHTHLKAKTAVVINTVEEWSDYVSNYFIKDFESRGGKKCFKYEEVGVLFI